MNCVAVKKSLSGYMDRQLLGAPRLELENHLARCSDCSLEFSQLSRLRYGLRSLPSAILPERLRIDLRAMASQESFRRHYARSQVMYWGTRLRLMVDNMMRPLALPCAGGLASAVVLFGALMPSISFTRNFANDVPTPIYQEASIIKVH
ncbi:MAG: zf-HC2 domain-containing protein, partial [Bryobacteraceae bacterium]